MTTTINLAHLSHAKGVARGHEDADTDTSAHHPLYITLFRNVSNASHIRQQLLDQNTDFEYAFVDASTVISTTHALSAAYRALNDMRAGRLRTRNVHAEIVFAFSASNNIASSLRSFGITPQTTNLLAIKVGDAQIDASSVHKHLTGNIQGNVVPFCDEEIAGMTDWGIVRKNYKLPKDFLAPSQKGADGSVEERRLGERIAMGGMALRGA